MDFYYLIGKLHLMKFINKWALTFAKSIQLQLFITIISLPFLIAWGLPVSLVSPVSTLIFSPFLTVFLLLSSITFFFELCYLPNSWIVYCLEQAACIWLWLLDFEQRTWLVAFARPPLIVLFAIPVSALAILHAKKLRTPLVSMACLALLLIGAGVLIKIFYFNTHVIEKIPCNKGHVLVIQHNKQLVVVDPAHIASRPSYESWIAYTLVPAIIKSSGSMTIDYLVVCKISARTFDALQLLAHKMNIKTIYLPKWSNKIPKFAWTSYIKLKDYIKQQGGKIVLVHKNHIIFDSENAKLTIELADSLNYYNASYRQLCITGDIGDVHSNKTVIKNENVA